MSFEFPTVRQAGAPLLLANAVALPAAAGGGLGIGEFVAGLRLEALRGGAKAGAAFITKNMESLPGVMSTREGRIALAVATTSFVAGFAAGSFWVKFQSTVAALQALADRHLPPAAMAREVAKLLSARSAPVSPSRSTLGEGASATSQQRALQPLTASIEQTQGRLADAYALRAGMGNRADDALDGEIKALRSKLQDLVGQIERVSTSAQGSERQQPVRVTTPVGKPAPTLQPMRNVRSPLETSERQQAQSRARDEAQLGQQQKAQFLTRLNAQARASNGANVSTLRSWIQTETSESLATRVTAMKALLSRPSLGNVYAYERFADGKKPAAAGNRDFEQYNYSGSLLTRRDLKYLIKELSTYLGQVAKERVSAQTAPRASGSDDVRIDAPALQALNRIGQALSELAPRPSDVPASPADRAALAGRAIEKASLSYPGTGLKDRVESLFGALGFPPGLVWRDSNGGDLVRQRFASDGSATPPGEPPETPGGSNNNSEPPKKPGFVEQMVKGLIVTSALSAVATSLGAPAWLRAAIEWWPFDGGLDEAGRLVGKSDDVARLGGKLDDIGRPLLSQGERLSEDGTHIVLRDGRLLSREAREAELGIGKNGSLSSKGQRPVDALEEATEDFQRSLNPDLVKVGKLNVNGVVAHERLEADFKQRAAALVKHAIDKKVERKQFAADTSRMVDDYIDRQLGAKGSGDVSLQTFREKLRAELKDDLSHATFDVPANYLPVSRLPKPPPGADDLRRAEAELDAIPGVDVSDLKYDSVLGVVTGTIRPDPDWRQKLPFIGGRALSEQQLKLVDAELMSLERNKFSTIPNVPIQLVPEKGVQIPRPLYQPKGQLPNGGLRTTTPEAATNFGRNNPERNSVNANPNGGTGNAGTGVGAPNQRQAVNPSRLPGNEKGSELIPIESSPAVNAQVNRRLIGTVPTSEAGRTKVIEELMAYGTPGAPHYRVAEVAQQLREDLIERMGEAAYRKVDARGHSWSQMSNTDLVALDVYLDAGNVELNAARRQQFTLDKFFWRSEYLSNANPAAARLGTSDGTHVRLALQTGEIAQEALRKAPVFEGTVYRGVRLRPEELRKHTPGTLISYPAFTSTAAEQGAAFTHHPVLLKIKSISGADLRALNPHEAEILFPPDSQFRVLNRRTLPGGTIEIEMEQLR